MDWIAQAHAAVVHKAVYAILKLDTVLAVQQVLFYHCAKTVSSHTTY